MPKTAFISYSHDSGDFKAWILRLATDLRSSGVDALLDRWHLRPGEEAGLFMARSVRESDKVVVVCSDNYVTKAENRVGGAGFEGSMVTTELVADQGTAKFIPIIRDNSSGRIPSFLAGRIYIDFRVDASYEESLTTLLRAIHNQPVVDIPPIGELSFGIPTSTNPAAQPTEIDRPITVHELEDLLQDHQRRIRLSRELWNAADSARAALAATSIYDFDTQPTAESVLQKVTEVESAMADALPLLVTMGQWATPEQIRVAGQVVARFLDIPNPKGAFYEANRNIANYPALLAMYAVGLGALVEERFDNLRAVLFSGVPSERDGNRDIPFVEALHVYAPFAQDFWKLLPSLERRLTPLSDHVFEHLRAALPSAFRSTLRPERLFDRLESAISLAYVDAKGDEYDWSWAPLGSYLWRDRMLVKTLQDELKSQGSEWAPIRAGFFAGSVDRATRVLDTLAKHIMRVRQQLGVY